MCIAAVSKQSEVALLVNQEFGINYWASEWMSGMFLSQTVLGQPRLTLDVPTDAAGGTGEVITINNLQRVGMEHKS